MMRYAAKLQAYLILSAFLLLPCNTGAQTDIGHVTPGSPLKNLRPNFYDTKLTEAQKVMLAPLPEDQSAHAAFLKQKNTGICRLHPRGKYEPNLLISAKEGETGMALPVPGGGAYFSFTERMNKFGPWSDICLQDNRLTGNGINLTVSILTDLGDVPLSSVTPATPGLTPLTQLRSPKKSPELNALLEKSSQGFEANGFTYRPVAPATPGTTYAMRSILYQRYGRFVIPEYDPYYRLPLSKIGYDGSDVLVALRVIRLHDDGSVTILWKRLQKFGTPQLTDVPRKSIRTLMIER